MVWRYECNCGGEILLDTRCLQRHPREFHMYGDTKENEEYEIWTELLPVHDWVALEKE